MATTSRMRFHISKRIVALLSVLVFSTSLGLYSYRAFAVPLPLATVSLLDLKQSPSEPVVLPWSKAGQSALGSLTEGVIAQSSQKEVPRPIASITKVITSLAVLKKKPLTINEDGPTITLSDEDVAIYNQYVAAGGSTAKVQTGEVITERQMLEGLLLPSANNLADSLAVWAFGSLDTYIVYANTLLKSWGIADTNVQDASGFSDTTTSTATDLVKIGQKALEHPVIEQIVQKKESFIPVAGQIRNTNQLLNNGGIGIKTGHTDAAGGCLLFATKYTISEKSTITIIGSVLGQTNMTAAFQAAGELLNESRKGFIERTIIHKDDPVGNYSTKWGATTNIVAQDSLIYAGWHDMPITTSVIVTPIKTVKAGQESGAITMRVQNKTQSVPIVTQNSINPPTFLWRARHGLSI